MPQPASQSEAALLANLATVERFPPDLDFEQLQRGRLGRLQEQMHKVFSVDEKPWYQKVIRSVIARHSSTGATGDASLSSTDRPRLSMARDANGLRGESQ